MSKENKSFVFCRIQLDVIVAVVPGQMVNKHAVLLRLYVQRRPHMLGWEEQQTDSLMAELEPEPTTARLPSNSSVKHRVLAPLTETAPISFLRLTHPWKAEAGNAYPDILSQ